MALQVTPDTRPAGRPDPGHDQPVDGWAAVGRTLAEPGRQTDGSPSRARRSPGRSRVVRSVRTLVVGLLTALVTATGLVAPARSAEWIVLCTGYDPCATAGYPNYGYKESAATSWWRQSTGHNCTNYVAYRLVKNGLPNTKPATLSGNALNWGPAFPTQTNDSPAVGAVAWWDASFSSTGHVAYVEKVVSPTEIIVSEDNWGGEFKWRRITFGGGRWPTGFIHLKDQGPSFAAPTRAWQPAASVRLLDTKTGVGVTAGRLPAGRAVTFQVAGRAGLPATGVGAVVLNVNTTAPSAAGYLTVHASGTTQPASRNVSYPATATTTQTVLTRVGADGKVRLYTSAATDVSADLVGWSPAGGFVSGGAPARVLDTRTGLAAPKAKLASGGRLELVLAGKAGIPTTGAQSVLLEVTALGATGAGWLSAFASGTTRPVVLEARYDAVRPTTALVLAQLGTNGAVSLHATTTTDVLVDVVGWLPQGADLVATTPAKVLDSQAGLGVATAGRVAAGSTVSIPVRGRAGVPSTGVQSVVLSVAAVSPLAAGYLTAFPGGATEPAYATVKHVSGQYVSNTVVVPLGADGTVRVKSAASTYLTVSVQGYVRS